MRLPMKVRGIFRQPKGRFEILKYSKNWLRGIINDPCQVVSVRMEGERLVALVRLVLIRVGGGCGCG